MLNVHGKTLCQPRQNHLDQQQTLNFTIRETNPDYAKRPPQAPLSRSDLVREPTAEVSKSCCARSQHENRRDRIIIGLAARRENQPFMHVAARKRARIYRLRDKAAAPVAGDNARRAESKSYLQPTSHKLACLTSAPVSTDRQKLPTHASSGSPITLGSEQPLRRAPDCKRQSVWGQSNPQYSKKDTN